MSAHADIGAPPLAGLRVLEVSRTAGPAFCTKLLAEMGLDVVTVEPPEGHALRRAAPQAALRSGTVSALWLYLAAAKRSVVVDRAVPSGSHALDELVAAADLVVHDLPQRSAREQGLDLELLRELRPGIVVASITPFGSTGPYANMPASELTVHALSGQLYLTGLESREPLLPYGHQPSMFAGVVGATAALAAVLRAREDGVARHVEVSAQEALAGALDTALNRFTYAGKTRGRHGNRLPDRTPLTEIYRTRDGFFLICVYTEPQWRGFCSMVGRPDWPESPGLRTLAGRLQHAPEIEAVMTAWFAARTSSEALEECQRHRLPSCIASSIPQVLRDPQLLAREHFTAVDDHDAGRLLYPRLPWLPSSGTSREAAAPGLGEHGPDVRQDWRPRPATEARKAADPRALPLAGIRVLDVTHAWAGPFGGLQLGFLGAEMIKVEGARRPDGTRYVSRDARNLQPDYETGGYFHEWNRNKRAAAINMDDAEGRALMLDLVRRSDVLINNYSARVLPKWGLDWPALHQLNPRLVLVTMPAFGSQGPYREYVGYGETLEGAGGLARLSGYEPGKPIRSGIAYPDPLVGHFGALAVVLGLAHRAQSGAGSWLDLSHQECVLHMVGDAVLHYQLTGATQEPNGNDRADLLLNAVLACRGDDDWVAITVETPAELRALAAATGIEELATAPVGQEALARLRAWTRSQDKRSVMERMVQRGVASGAVLKIDELGSDPHLVERAYFERVAHPVVGEKRHPRAGFRIDGADVATRLPAPLFDGATDEILTTILGKTAGEIASFRQRGIIGGTPAGTQLPS